MKKVLLLLPILVLLLNTAVYSQTPVSDQDVDLMQRSQMVIEIKKLRAENSVLKDENTILKEQAKNFDALFKVEEGRISDLKASNADLKDAFMHSSNAGNISDKIEVVYKESLADYKAENQRLRIDNANLRKSRDRRSLLFGLAGLAFGHFLF